VDLFPQKSSPSVQANGNLIRVTSAIDLQTKALQQKVRECSHRQPVVVAKSKTAASTMQPSNTATIQTGSHDN
jgi:hypothetical protein